MTHLFVVPGARSLLAALFRPPLHAADSPPAAPAAPQLRLLPSHPPARHPFSLAGDYNLPLLDGLAQVPGLTLVNTANELNAGYAADGHARAVGLGCVVTTFLVGALSAINATAASFAEEVPVLSVVGAPSTQQYAQSAALHHTL